MVKIDLERYNELLDKMIESDRQLIEYKIFVKIIENRLVFDKYITKKTLRTQINRLKKRLIK